MGVEDLIKNKNILVGDLEEGKIYQGELIIERDEKDYLNMVTARKEGEEIWTSRHHVISQFGKVKLIILDGGQKYFLGDKEYDKLNKMLKNST